MPDRGPSECRTVTTLDMQRATAEAIGEQLRLMVDKVLAEPLPEKMTDLLAELERKA